MKCEWNFVNDNSYEEHLNDDGSLFLFEKGLWEYFAREVIQNSNDQLQLDAEKSIMVKFELKKIPCSKIPGIDTIKNIINQCMNKVNENAKARMKSGLNELNKPETNMLIVSDYNTMGADGSDEDINAKNHWNALIYKEGESCKTGVTNSSGSHGLGKNSAFAITPINTVFYSTISSNKTKDDEISAFEGVSRLYTWYAGQQKKHHKGYYCMNECGQDLTPIKFDQLSTYNIDSIFARKEKGLSMYIPIITEEADKIKKNIIQAVIDNFFYAIYTNKLIVDAFGTIISKDTVNEILNSYDTSFEKSNYGGLTKGLGKQYYEALYTTPILYDGGKILFYIDIDTQHKKKYTAFVRSRGMKIMEKAYSSEKCFAAVAVVVDEEWDKFLLGLEDPSHDQFNIDKISDPEIRKYSKERLNKLFKWVDEQIQEHTKTKYEKRTRLFGLDQYIQLLDSNDAYKKPEATFIKAKHNKLIPPEPIVPTPKINNEKNEFLYDNPIAPFTREGRKIIFKAKRDAVVNISIIPIDDADNASKNSFIDSIYDCKDQAQVPFVNNKIMNFAVKADQKNEFLLKLNRPINGKLLINVEESKYEKD